MSVTVLVLATCLHTSKRVLGSNGVRQDAPPPPRRPLHRRRRHPHPPALQRGRVLQGTCTAITPCRTIYRAVVLSRRDYVGVRCMQGAEHLCHVSAGKRRSAAGLAATPPAPLPRTGAALSATPLTRPAPPGPPASWRSLHHHHRELSGSTAQSSGGGTIDPASSSEQTDCGWACAWLPKCLSAVADLKIGREPAAAVLSGNGTTGPATLQARRPAPTILSARKFRAWVRLALWPCESQL